MSRILHLIASDSIGGPEKQLLHHARDAREAEYEVILEASRMTRSRRNFCQLRAAMASRRFRYREAFVLAWWMI